HHLSDPVILGEIVKLLVVVLAYRLLQNISLQGLYEFVGGYNSSLSQRTQHHQSSLL
ncbi:12648_t:CDS:1, partial [Racocetra persica]